MTEITFSNVQTVPWLSFTLLFGLVSIILAWGTIFIDDWLSKKRKEET